MIQWRQCGPFAGVVPETTRAGVRELVFLGSRWGRGVVDRMGDSSALRMKCRGARGDDAGELVEWTERGLAPLGL